MPDSTNYGQPSGPPAPGASAAPASPTLKGVDPSVVQRLADQYGLDYETAALLLQYRRASALTGQMPQGRQVGDVFKASSPLEMASGAVREGLGQRGMQEAMRRANALGPRAVKDARAAYDMYGAPPLTDPEDVNY